MSLGFPTTRLRISFLSLPKNVIITFPGTSDQLTINFSRNRTVGLKDSLNHTSVEQHLENKVEAIAFLSLQSGVG